MSTAKYHKKAAEHHSEAAHRHEELGHEEEANAHMEAAQAHEAAATANASKRDNKSGQFSGSNDLGNPNEDDEPYGISSKHTKNAMEFCPECGGELDDDDVCEECGYIVNDNTVKIVREDPLDLDGDGDSPYDEDAHSLEDLEAFSDMVTSNRVDNAWSDAAREASATARHATGEAFEKSDEVGGSEHADKAVTAAAEGRHSAAATHHEAAAKEHASKDHEEASEMHTEAASLHRSAMKMGVTTRNFNPNHDALGRFSGDSAGANTLTKKAMASNLPSAHMAAEASHARAAKNASSNSVKAFHEHAEAMHAAAQRGDKKGQTKALGKMAAQAKSNQAADKSKAARFGGAGNHEAAADAHYAAAAAHERAGNAGAASRHTERAEAHHKAAESSTRNAAEPGGSDDAADSSAAAQQATDAAGGPQGSARAASASRSAVAASDDDDSAGAAKFHKRAAAAHTQAAADSDDPETVDAHKDAAAAHQKAAYDHSGAPAPAPAPAATTNRKCGVCGEDKCTCDTTANEATADAVLATNACSSALSAEPHTYAENARLAAERAELGSATHADAAKYHTLAGNAHAEVSGSYEGTSGEAHMLAARAHFKAADVHNAAKRRGKMDRNTMLRTLNRMTDAQLRAAIRNSGGSAAADDKPTKRTIQAGGQEDDELDRSDDTPGVAMNRWIASMPPAARSTWQLAQEVEKREKVRIVNHLVAHMQDPVKKRQKADQLMTMNRQSLLELMELVPTQTRNVDTSLNFLGAAGGIVDNSTFDETADILPLPTINYNEEAS